MAMFLVTPPALEPVTIADARAFLKISTDSEDEILGRLLKTARELVEAETGLAFIDQTWRLRVDRWPRSGRVALFKYPVKSIVSVVAYMPDGTAVNFQPEDFLLQHGRRPQRVYMPQYQDARSVIGLEIDFEAGFGESGAEMPDTLKHAVLSLTAHLFETRAVAPIPGASTTFPPLIDRMVDSWRRVSI
ncbi:phage head-tail connector protein [Falsochrobactrum ovis]|uniref:Putative phiE125 gp8 family phage protein n=1 Tax=Falsochrobactrum ovis TaxID=1293442 RepID=A0A364K073_9HYPH|nr:phage head-tail connector protein [Falsochrobactrum ovis]RAK34366.1 putative phiE125 gp8 family phage protein [Falsochrobactrum ovis]